MGVGGEKTASQCVAQRHGHTELKEVSVSVRRKDITNRIEVVHTCEHPTDARNTRAKCIEMLCFLSNMAEIKCFII